MKDYGHLLGTAEAAAFSARVRRRPRVARRRASTGCPRRPAPLGPVIVQDPCHLRHVQRAHEPVRAVLGHVADVVELDDDGLCCGAGGAYSALQPELATAVRERKVAAIGRAADRSGATVVASANPGCAMHLARRRARRAPPGRPRRRGLIAAVTVSRYEELAERLEAIGDELDELSFDLLQQAVADGATERPAADRTLTQARRAVEKAAGLLRQLGALTAVRLSCRPARIRSHRIGTPGATGGTRAVEGVDQRPQVAGAVAAEGEADARQLDVVVVAALDVERRRCARSGPRATRWAKRSLSSASCASVGAWRRRTTRKSPT